MNLAMREHLLQTAHDLWYILGQGGWVMGAIFIAGQVGWFLVLERWWHLRKMDGRRQIIWKRAPAHSEALAHALRSGQGAKGLFGRVAGAITETRDQGRGAMVAKAREILQEHVPGLSLHLGTLAILAGTAPLLGLTGTVAGIMATFRVITLYGAGNPSMMAGGIAQALMVTEAGLVVAFPLLLCHDHLQKRADAIEDECVADATRLIRLYAGGEKPA
jgi:biopolymer transport protein ExbB